MIDKYSGTYRGPPRGTSTPYSEVLYYDPIFYEWKDWFAWYPVKQVYYYHHEDGFGQGIRVYKWVWLKKILRRKVVDAGGKPRLRGPQAKTVHYEYTTLMDMLKYGH